MRETFRQKLGGGKRLIGSFVKTPAPQVVELAGLSGFDFVILDAEHAPFASRELDLGILAGRAAGVDVLVRLPGESTSLAQQALDLGAAGIVAPHIDSPAAAAAAVASARFKGGRRGYSNSPRFGAYGTAAMRDLLDAADDDAAVILQIEDAAGMGAVEQIAASAGVDALFVGRADLAVAFGTDDTRSPIVDELAGRIVGAARRAGVAVATFFPDPDAYFEAGDDGIDMLVLGSDQSVLRAGWSAALAQARRVATTPAN